MARITESGMQGTTLLEYLNFITNGINTALGGNVAFDPETPQGQITNVLGMAFEQVDEGLVATANGLDIFSAVGFQLDALVSIFGVNRIDATHSRGTVTFRGTPGTEIPIGTTITDADNNVTVRVLALNGTSFIGADGVVDLLCENRYPGSS